MSNVNAAYNDYHVMSYENGNVVSCYRDTLIEEVVVKDAMISNDTTCWGPQYKIQTQVEEIDGQLFVIGCDHNAPLLDAEEGYVCSKCGEYFVAEYECVDILDEYGILSRNNDKFYEAICNESMFIQDHNFIDIIKTTKPNPNLIGRGFSHDIKSDLDTYDMYTGWTIDGEYYSANLDPIVDEFKEYEKCEYNNDVNDATDKEFIFSKERTEMPKELLNFYGYPSSKFEAGRSFLRSAIKYSKHIGQLQLDTIFEMLSDDELDWAQELLDSEVVLSGLAKLMFPIHNVPKYFDWKRRYEAIKEIQFRILKVPSWTMQAVNPTNSLWGFYVCINNYDGRYAIKQLVNRFEPWYTKSGSEVIMEDIFINRKDLITRFLDEVKKESAKLEIIGDSKFVEYVSNLK